MKDIDATNHSTPHVAMSLCPTAQTTMRSPDHTRIPQHVPGSNHASVLSALWCSSASSCVPTPDALSRHARPRRTANTSSFATGAACLGASVTLTTWLRGMSRPRPGMTPEQGSTVKAPIWAEVGPCEAAAAPRNWGFWPFSTTTHSASASVE